MSASRTIARILGPSAVAVAATEWMNMDIFAAQTAPVVYLNGTLLFVGGLAIVQAHNRWAWGWPLLVTLAGWALAVAGLARMIAPGAAQVEAGFLADLVFAVLFAAGLWLSYEGYGRRGGG
ncbi:MAG: hypothetical protein ACK4YQ_07355 [Phenylobacterium sp.]|uniref:hypothetical protein n=1 Tax=Phenylobacterium sp. TaxID=1871053 RepID=UPI00391C338E